MTRLVAVSMLPMAVFLLMYYLLLIKEKSFAINRIYLLASAILSLVVPLISIPIAIESSDAVNGLSEAIEVSSLIRVDRFADVASESTTLPKDNLTLNVLLNYLYVVGILIMLVRMLRGLVSIRKLIISGLISDVNGYHVVLNDQIKQPFTFWKYIFIQRRDQMQDDDLMSHEQSHVYFMHSVDVLIIEILIVLCWFNPLVYCYRRAIRLNHEYQVDDRVIKHPHKLKNYLSSLIEAAQYNPINIPLTSNFSYLSLKNRLKMIYKNRPTRILSISRWITVLLLLSIFICSFVIKPESQLNRDEEFVVVLDPGHGGKDHGAIGKSGFFEKDVVLNVARLVQLEFKGSNVKIITTRSGDDFLSLEERVNKTKDADLNISLHVEVMQGTDKEQRLFIYNEAMRYAQESEYLARIIAAQFGDEDYNEVGYSDYYVLKNAKCPSVMAIIGVFSNPEMEAEMTSSVGQREIAQRLVKAIKLAAR